MASFGLLYQALGRAGSGPAPPADLVAAVQTLPAAGALPSPWETWTLIGLVRHHRRQFWVGEVITTRLNGSLTDLAPDRQPPVARPRLPVHLKCLASWAREW